MKIGTTKNGEIVLTEVYSGVLLETRDKETMGICMRDTGFEFNYNGVWYEAKQGILREMKCNTDIEQVDSCNNNQFKNK